MAAEEAAARFRIAPFDPACHERSVFSCGVERLDNYLQRTAKKHQSGDFARVFVALVEEDPRVVGYYAINAHSIEAPDLPTALVRNAPRHGGVPAAYLSMIAVDRRAQGQGLGRILLADALKRLIPVSAEIGVAAVVLDVFEDDGAEAAARRRAFYVGMGFRCFPSNPSRMFLMLKDIRAAFEA